MKISRGTSVARADRTKVLSVSSGPTRRIRAAGTETSPIRTSDVSQPQNSSRCEPRSRRAASAPWKAGARTHTEQPTPTMTTAPRMRIVTVCGVNPGNNSCANAESARRLKVQIQPAGRWHILAAVLAAPRRPIRLVRWRGHQRKRQLPDAHARVQSDRQIGQIADFERYVAFEGGVYEPGCIADEHAAVTSQEILHISCG